MLNSIYASHNLKLNKIRGRIGAEFISTGLLGRNIDFDVMGGGFNFKYAVFDEVGLF